MISYKIRVAFNILLDETNKILEEYKQLYDLTQEINTDYIYNKLYSFFKEDLSFSNIPIFLKKEDLTGRLIFIVDNSVILNKRGVKTVGNLRLTFKFPKKVNSLEEIKNFLKNIADILDKHNL